MLLCFCILRKTYSNIGFHFSHICSQPSVIGNSGIDQPLAHRRPSGRRHNDVNPGIVFVFKLHVVRTLTKPKSAYFALAMLVIKIIIIIIIIINH